MARKNELLGRSEIRNRIEKSAKDMGEKENELKKGVADIDTISRTLEKIEGTTKEGFDQVTKSIKEADHVTRNEFESQDKKLDLKQKESEQFGKEIQESHDSGQSDLSKFSAAIAEFKTKEPDKDFQRAKEQTLTDIENLKEQREQEGRAREKSEAIQKELNARIRAKITQRG